MSATQKSWPSLVENAVMTAFARLPESIATLLVISIGVAAVGIFIAAFLFGAVAGVEAFSYFLSRLPRP